MDCACGPLVCLQFLSLRPSWPPFQSKDKGERCQTVSLVSSYIHMLLFVTSLVRFQGYTSCQFNYLVLVNTIRKLFDFFAGKLPSWKYLPMKLLSCILVHKIDQANPR